MATASIEFRDQEIKKYLRKVMSKMRVPSKILKPIAIIHALKDIDDHFKKEQGDKGKWKPRSSFTQQYYRAIQVGELAPPKGHSRAQYNPANKILQMTGTLRGSFKPSAVREHTKNAVLIRSNVDYSGKHQYGKRGTPRIPKRPFMWMSGRAMKNMARALLKTITGE